MKRSRVGLVSVACLLLTAEGCAHHFFKVSGSMTSDGGALGTWDTRPVGCARDPAPPPAVGRYNDVATLLWDDTLMRNHWLNTHSPHAGNQPARLEIWRRVDGPDAGKVYARMEMQKPVSSVDLNPQVCPVFEVTTKDGKPLIDGGRPTLEGSVRMECQVGDSQVKGQLAFSGCEY